MSDQTDFQVSTDDDPQFSVYWYDINGEQTRDQHFVLPEVAVQAAKELTLRDGVMRVIIVDALDLCNFEWVRGKGVVFGA